MKEIQTWKRLTNRITEQFIRDYFEIEVEEEIDISWVSDDVGSVFEFAGMYFNFSDVLDCYKYKISKEQLFGWYDFCLENQFVNISLARFILSPQEKKEQEEKQLSQLKERVKLAEKEFKEALEKYNGE
jgi:hypothetical protein